MLKKSPKNILSRHDVLVLPVCNQERRNEGEESDDDMEHCGSGDQRGGVDSSYRTAPHLVPYNTVLLFSNTSMVLYLILDIPTNFAVVVSLI